MSGRIHVVGAGVAGLSAATALAEQGRDVILSDGARQAGGRCRSYVDERLGRRIDNGNHLLLSGNWAVRDYLARIGALDELVGPDRASFPFVDVKTGERWVVKPGRGRLPFWLFREHMRVPDTNILDYLKAFRLRAARDGDNPRDLLNDGRALYRRLWEPLCLGVLNTDPNEAQAKLLWPVLAETFMKGEAACRPRVAKRGLSETFVDPALAYLNAKGGRIGLSRRLKGLDMVDGFATKLRFAGEEVEVKAEDRVVLALPPYGLKALMPNLAPPETFRMIVNAHFILPRAPENLPWLVGLINGAAHWIFVRNDIASATIGAAERLADADAESIAETLWPEVCLSLRIPASPLPRYRIVKEKRATFAQIPSEVAKRPKPDAIGGNIVLAGDWTDTGVPASIEGAIRSGLAAAELVDKPIAAT